MKKILSKLLLLLLLTTYYLLHSALPVHAQSSNYQNSLPVQSIPVQQTNPYIAPNTTADVKPGLHTWVPAVMNEMMSSIVCVLGGVDPITKTNNCLGITSNGKLGYTNQGGLNRLMSSTIGTMYQNGFPIGTNTYLSYLKDNFGFVKDKAYAKGPEPVDQSPISGFVGLSPLINIWSVIRNLAYLLIIIAFIFIGLAIMLRVKIDPRTVMTIENQLPKLVAGLLFVTFSFAIAGLMVDGMKILDGLIFNVYQSIPGDTINHNINWKHDIQDSNPWDAASVVVPTSNKLVPIDTGSIHIGGFTLNFPILDGLPQTIKILIGLIPGIGDIFKALGSSQPGQAVSFQQGFGNGIVTIAGASAYSFGSVLNTFFKLNTPGDAPSDILGSNGGIFGFFTAPFTFILSDLGHGTPAGAIVDIASSILSGSFAFKLGQAVSSLGDVGSSPGITVPLGTILMVPTIPIAYVAFFDFIDGALRNLGVPVVVWFIVYIAIFLAMARLFFNLVNAWATILFQVVIGPLLIVFGLVPGLKSGGFTAWLKTLAANLMAFPITIGIFLLGSAIVQSLIGNQDYFIPPLVAGGILPVGLLMAINVLFAASNGPAIAKDLFQEKENKNFGAFGQSSGQSLQAVYKAGKATVYGFGKTPTPGQRGGAMGAFNVLG